MALRVTHILQSFEAYPGAVVISLEGAVAPLAGVGIESRLVAQDADQVEVRTHEGTSDTLPLEASEFTRDAGIVHIHGWGYPLAEVAVRAAARLKKPAVISPHGAFSPARRSAAGLVARLRGRWRQRGAARRAAVLTALNTHEERELRDVHSHVRSLPYGLTFDEYTPGVEPQNADGMRWIVMLGSLHPRSGCVALLKALGEIGPDANGWNVALVGADGGEWRRMLEPAVRRKGAEDRVRVAAASTPDAQRQWLARASLVAAPSLQVTFPLSVMQGLAAGVPVLASSLAAPPGVDGLLRTCGPSRDELRRALRAALSQPDESRQAARSATGAARLALDWSVLAPRWAELYRELA